MSDRLHSYLRTVIDQVDAVVPPQGWRVMVGTQKDCPVLLAANDFPTSGDDQRCVWLHMLYATNNSAPVWRLDSEAMRERKPDTLLWAESWPSLQDAVGDLADLLTILTGGA